VIAWFRAHDPDEPPPEDVRELERLLAAIRFEPRASLGPELLGRVRRQEPKREPPRLPRSSRLPLIGFFLMAASGAWLVTSRNETTVDRCCYDLDGGGEADDGIAIRLRAGNRIHRITVYEDRDASRSWTRGDLLRYDRAPTLAIPTPPSEPLVMLRYCCRDYDGEGPDDDGLVIVAAPPDRVTMVGVYER
jgi:hypothetical protein